MKSKQKRDCFLTVRMRPSDYEELQKLASDIGVEVSLLVRETLKYQEGIIRQRLKEVKDNGKK